MAAEQTNPADALMKILEAAAGVMVSAAKPGAEEAGKLNAHKWLDIMIEEKREVQSRLGETAH